jgi:hypothetical protein
MPVQVNEFPSMTQLPVIQPAGKDKYRLDIPIPSTIAGYFKI